MMKYFDIVLKNLSSEFVQCDVCLTFLKNMLDILENLPVADFSAIDQLRSLRHAECSLLGLIQNLMML